MVRAMFRLVVVAAVALAACDQTDNNRPRTVQYITEAILQPNCAQDVCHSSYTRARGYAFDTVEAARHSLVSLVSPDEPESSLLYTVLTRSVKRMPYDAPLPDKDIALILEWIQSGAKTDLGISP
jgi:hypothetical protein